MRYFVLIVAFVISTVAAFAGDWAECFDQKTYPITVPYSGKTTIENLLKAGKYDQSDSRWINDFNFLQLREGTRAVAMRLVCLGRSVSNAEAMAELDERHLLPANAAELIAFGTAYPDVQRIRPIVALGQKWVDGYSHLGKDEPVFAMLSGDYDTRLATVKSLVPYYRGTEKWPSWQCFAAVAAH